MKQLIKFIYKFILSPIAAIMLCAFIRRGDKIKTIKCALAISVTFNKNERLRLTSILASYIRRGVSDDWPMLNDALVELNHLMAEKMYTWDYKKQFYIKQQ